MKRVEETTDRAHERISSLPAVLTASEAAAYLRVSKWAIYDAVAAGTLPAIRIGRGIRIPRSALVAQPNEHDGSPI